MIVLFLVMVKAIPRLAFTEDDCLQCNFTNSFKIKSLFFFFNCMFKNVYLSEYDYLQPNICLLTSVRLVFCICRMWGKKIKVDFPSVCVRFNKQMDKLVPFFFLMMNPLMHRNMSAITVMADMLSGFKKNSFCHLFLFTYCILNPFLPSGS